MNISPETHNAVAIDGQLAKMVTTGAVVVSSDDISIAKDCPIARHSELLIIPLHEWNRAINGNTIMLCRESASTLAAQRFADIRSSTPLGVVAGVLPRIFD